MPNKTKITVKDASKIWPSRRSESEELGLPPYNYQARSRMDNASGDTADIQILGQSNSLQPSTSNDQMSVLRKPYKSTFKAPTRTGLVNENNKDDDDIRILTDQCGPSTSSAVPDRYPLSSKQNTGSVSGFVAMSAANKSRKSICGPTADAFLTNASWRRPNKAPASKLRSRPNFMSTSTPMRLSDLHHVSAESRGIKRQGILNKVRDIEGKRRYWELIKEHNPIHGTSRRVLLPRPTKTPPLIDLTLNETEICKDLDIVPKPVRSSLLPSTPQITSRFKKPEILDDDEVQYVKNVPRKNSWKDELVYRDMIKSGPPSITQSYFEKRAIKQKEIQDIKLRVNLTEKKSKEIFEDNLLSNVEKNISRFDLQKLEEDIPEIEEEELLPEIPEDGIKIVERALYPVPASEVLVSGFNTDISRKDIQTLGDRNWLNDEIINFYMELIRERGTLDNYPKVHAFNTFFYPKLRQSGHAVLKRWTKKIDIFAHDIIVVPIHLEVHWCMSILDMKNKTAYYYDSMLANNSVVLKLLMEYLEVESMDKKKVPYDTSGWKLIQDKDIPQQHNGYDCGVFACMFAEAASRRSKFLFTQEDMPSLRRRMVYEILTKKLLA